MLTLRDVIDYSNLTESEIDAIAAHEHVPKIIAAQMACQLDQLSASPVILKQMMREAS
jgi:hypothetical protein